MTLSPSAIGAEIDSVVAALNYCDPMGEKPVTGSGAEGDLLRYRSGNYQPHQTRIRDGRALRFALERDGFAFVRHDTRIRDFFDAAELRAVYYPEIERLVKETSGAQRVVIFDHTLRSGDEATRNAQKIREPVMVVHNDYTEWSGPQRVRDLLPSAEAAELLRHRFAVIQVWRPIRARVLSAPLAICDAQSIDFADLIPTERRYPDRVGEIYSLAYNPKQRWYYFPEMARNEALVFKCFDSETGGPARFTAHSAFVDPNTAPDAPPRESIEVRTLAFFTAA